MVEPPRLLIYNRDAPLRQAYAHYLARQGILTHSCNDWTELFRLLLWHSYEAILLDLDTVLQSFYPLPYVLQRYLPETIIIGTSNRPPLEVATLAEHLHLPWYMLEPLTPKRVLGMMSLIKDSSGDLPDRAHHLKLCQRLSSAAMLSDSRFGAGIPFAGERLPMR